jgi:Flp pilus assembly protein TadD
MGLFDWLLRRGPPPREDSGAARRPKMPRPAIVQQLGENLGDMWLRRNNYEKALEAFAQLVRLRPEDAQSYLGRGMAQEALGDLEKAAADYSTAIRLQPDGVCPARPGPPWTRPPRRRPG